MRGKGGRLRYTKSGPPNNKYVPSLTVHNDFKPRQEFCLRCDEEFTARGKFNKVCDHYNALNSQAPVFPKVVVPFRLVEFGLGA